MARAGMLQQLLRGRRQWLLAPKVPMQPLSSSSSSKGIAPQLNINLALIKKEEMGYFNDIVKHPVTTLQGIGPKHSEQLANLGIKSIQQLADYKFYLLAKSIKTLSQVEEENNRLEGAVMNLDKGVDKQFEHYCLAELVRQPVHALQGISPTGAETFQTLGVKTIEDLAEFKYCKWAEAIVVAAKFEDMKKES
ncbi:expressed unknown protein [Seminavis robusta]|uniref:Uncharacterized protein n=1 Tax=Seminavis robusta TaxID=568900 RepID=A0A9N8HBC8_9STRA|nr:expressed unknown protein [Seminavis robusta]|eukprot:Sro272_g104800.1 n/a (193) ;mRNA; f:18001-18579